MAVLYVVARRRTRARPAKFFNFIQLLLAVGSAILPRSSNRNAIHFVVATNESCLTSAKTAQRELVDEILRIIEQAHHLAGDPVCFIGDVSADFGSDEDEDGVLIPTHEALSEQVGVAQSFISHRLREIARQRSNLVGEERHHGSRSGSAGFSSGLSDSSPATSAAMSMAAAAESLVALSPTGGNVHEPGSPAQHAAAVNGLVSLGLDYATSTNSHVLSCESAEPPPSSSSSSSEQFQQLLQQSSRTESGVLLLEAPIPEQLSLQDSSSSCTDVCNDPLGLTETLSTIGLTIATSTRSRSPNGTSAAAAHAMILSRLDSQRDELDAALNGVHDALAQLLAAETAIAMLTEKRESLSVRGQGFVAAFHETVEATTGEMRALLGHLQSQREENTQSITRTAVGYNPLIATTRCASEVHEAGAQLLRFKAEWEAWGCDMWDHAPIAAARVRQFLVALALVARALCPMGYRTPGNLHWSPVGRHGSLDEFRELIRTLKKLMRMFPPRGRFRGIWQEIDAALRGLPSLPGMWVRNGGQRSRGTQAGGMMASGATHGIQAGANSSKLRGRRRGGGNTGGNQGPRKRHRAAEGGSRQNVASAPAAAAGQTARWTTRGPPVLPLPAGGIVL